MGGDGVVEDVDEDWPPKDERGVGDDDGFDFPLREGSSPGGIAPPEGKSAPAQVPPRGGGSSSQKSSSDFFSRSNVTIYQKMGSGGGPRRPRYTRARPGRSGTPWWVVPTWLAPSGGFLLQYFLLNTKIISVKFQLHWSCAE